MEFGSDLINNLVNIVWIALIFIMSFFGQRIIITQILMKSEQFAVELENMTVIGKKHILKKIGKKEKEIKDSVDHFMNFFVIEPVNLDPYGIIKKIDHISNLSENRFKYFVNQIAPHLNPEEKANVMMGLSGALSLNQIAKVVRHFVELLRKTKNLQIALVLQMQLPLVERIAKALLDGTEALTNGWPIGDAAGAFVAANLAGDSRPKEMEEDTLVFKKKIKNRTVFVVKAKGPGGRLGKLGKIVEKLMKTEDVCKIITIDAAAKLEGEKSGTVAEGIGVAIGGIGVDRAYIENIAVEKSIPLDSIIIKMSQEEAIQPIRKEVLGAIPTAVKLIEKNVEDTKEKGSIIVVGVGNTAGVGNSKKAAEEAEREARKILKAVEERKKGEKRSWLGWLSG
jgi:hypothetical protein